LKIYVLIFAIVAVCLPISAKRNIVFILAEDLGIGDTNIYGGDRCLIEAPNIDKLAKGGLRFTDAHVSASVCGPTRTAIMAGTIPGETLATIVTAPGNSASVPVAAPKAFTATYPYRKMPGKPK